MAKVLLYLSIAAVLLLHYSHLGHAFPQPLDDSSSSEKPNEKKEISLLALSELKKMGTIFMEQGHIIVEKIIKDIETLKDQTPELQKHKKNFTDFEKKFENYNKMKETEAKDEELLKLANELSNIVEVYDAETFKEDKKEKELIAESFTRNGIDDMMKIFDKQFDESSQKIIEKVEAYLRGNENDTKIKEWLKEIKKDGTTIEKTDLLYQLIDLLEK